MQMLKTDKNIEDVKFILNNLRKEDKQELEILWGNDWYNKALDNIKKTSFLVLIGKDNYKKDVPIAMGGFEELFEKNEKIACVWLLSTDLIKNNKKLFFKTLANQLLMASRKYQIMYNYIYKSNFGAKEWLEKFGFRFNNPHPENIVIPEQFEFFYKIN